MHLLFLLSKTVPLSRSWQSDRSELKWNDVT